MIKINVVISKDDTHAVTDWNARQWYLDIKDGSDVFVSTSLMLNELRLGVRNKEVEPFDFIFNGKVICCNDKGELNDWPVGFMDHQGIQIKALMKGISYEQSKIEIQKLKAKANKLIK